MKKQNWRFEKTFGPASIAMILQLVAVLIFGVQFYDQVQATQKNNETRFAAYADITVKQNDHIEKIESAQTQLMLQITTLADHQTTQTDVIKEIRDNLTKRR